MKRSNIEDMMICDVVEAEGGYNYYGYLSSGEDSRSLIMRENAAETEYRYFFGKGSNYDVDFAARADLVYIKPNRLSGRG